MTIRKIEQIEEVYFKESKLNCSRGRKSWASTSNVIMKTGGRTVRKREPRTTVKTVKSKVYQYDNG